MVQLRAGAGIVEPTDSTLIQEFFNPKRSSKVLDSRMSWNEYFLGIAKAVAKRADCRRAQHGCVLVKDNRIVSAGYNGVRAGDERSCFAGDCPRGLLTNEECRSLSSYENCISSHAEQNAVAYSDWASTRGATAYITGKNCDMCRKLLLAAGIAQVVYLVGDEIVVEEL